MGIAKVSNILRMARDYRLSIEERMMFDWLVIKQEDFGVGNLFRCSIPQVHEATGLSRRQQDKAIKHFTELKFLQVKTTYYNNNPFRTYFVDFSVLAKPDVLSELISQESETYKEFTQWIGVLARQQKKPQKDSCIEGLDFSIVSDDMREFVKEWVHYKKERKQAYTPTSFVKCVKLILDMSGGDAMKAKEIIDFSISNNYAGLVQPSKQKAQNDTIHNYETGRIITEYDQHKFESKDFWQR